MFSRCNHNINQMLVILLKENKVAFRKKLAYNLLMSIKEVRTRKQQNLYIQSTRIPCFDLSNIYIGVCPIHIIYLIIFLGCLEVENNPLGNAALEERNIKKSEDIKVLAHMMSVC